MPSILIVGIIISTGFLLGEVLKRFGLPKVTGYIIGGVALNPDILRIVPADFVEQTDLITNISLAFITFSVGGTLYFPKVKKLGKSILSIAFFEASVSFLFVFLGFLCVSPFLSGIDGGNMKATFIPLSLLIAALAAPTDPSATLAVMHEYKAKGEVSSTIMGVAAFDDVLGIMNYSFANALALVLISGRSFDFSLSVLSPIFSMCGAVLIGVVLGTVFNILTSLFEKETEGALIVIIFAALFVCFGIANLAEFDELLSTMSMGTVVINFNKRRKKIFSMLERYTEEFIFVLFFTLSGMHLKISALYSASVLLILFFLFRAAGKFAGTYLGALMSGSSVKIRRYVAGGLIPQGGIVVGLALLISQTPSFERICGLVINVVIGAAVIHEIIGPIASKTTLRKAGEI